MLEHQSVNIIARSLQGGRLRVNNPSERSTQGWVIFYDQMTVSSRLKLRKLTQTLTIQIPTLASPPFERDKPTTLEFPLLLHVNYNTYVRIFLSRQHQKNKNIQLLLTDGDKI